MEGSGQIIRCIDSACLLGVIIDKDLCWHQHVNKVAGSALKLLMAMNRLTRPSFRLPATYMGRLYTAIVLVKIEYVLLVWYTPVRKGKTKLVQ
jgi:hypothetical protein